jgi:propionyl-CoA carboxylase beta chain
MKVKNETPCANHMLPENVSQPYDIREVIEQVIDDASFLEVHKDFAENIVVGFARLAGPQHWYCC